MPIFHVPATVWNSTVLIAGWACPLTVFENSLRRGPSRYRTGFLEQYVLKPLSCNELSRRGDVLLGVSAGLLNLGLYVDLLRPGYLG